ncbi:hypothetical protein CVT26_001471, partial [Gymnopilus dilepis]
MWWARKYPLQEGQDYAEWRAAAWEFYHSHTSKELVSASERDAFNKMIREDLMEMTKDPSLMLPAATRMKQAIEEAKLT